MSLPLKELEVQANTLIQETDTLEALEAVRVKFLGKKGLLTEQLKQLGQLSHEARITLGQEVNTLKGSLTLAIKSQQEKLLAEKLEAQLNQEKIDVTLPGVGQDLGAFHPISLALDVITQFFESYGFAIAQGPEIEDDFHNFTALNLPPHHPARAAQDTFYLEGEHLLRTHTSGVQIRVMQQQRPPLRVIAPGRVYRCDSDVTHTPMFHQVEGLWVDQSITFAELKGMLTVFLQHFFEKPVATRFRPSYFPFTEPSAEVDVACVKCEGRGCRLCKQTGWLEVLGCGMVHPNVFKAVNIDPKVYQGFAFGLGVERLAMLKFGLSDLRELYENDVRFLTQFSGW